MLRRHLVSIMPFCSGFTLNLEYPVKFVYFFKSLCFVCQPLLRTDVVSWSHTFQLPLILKNMSHKEYVMHHLKLHSFVTVAAFLIVYMLLLIKLCVAITIAIVMTIYVWLMSQLLSFHTDNYYSDL